VRLVRRAFTELGVDEVVAITMAVNTRSRAVMEKAGLRYARTVHLTWPEPLEGNERGDVEYRVRRDDCLRQPPGPGSGEAAMTRLSRISQAKIRRKAI
jgi:RimJ/RimL family protein N-acetyltransferase